MPKSNLKKYGTDVFGANGKIGSTNLPPLVKERTVAITSRGTGSGKVQVIKENSFLTNNLLYIIDKYSLGIPFIYESIKNANPSKVVTGSAQPQLTIKNFSSINILIPQHLYMDGYKVKMNVIENKIYENKKENANLKRIKNILLKNYFD